MARAVDGVDLTIREGRILGVVGESGSGKSVTGASIMGLIQRPGWVDPDSHILFKGRDLVKLSEKEWREIRGNEIAMVFQEPMTSLNPVFSVGDQIIENLRLHRRISKSDARARAIELMTMVGIPSPETRVDSYPHELSGGMRQRIVIAMALTCDPSLLIADEPTTALDVTIQAQILDLVVRLKDELGMGVMFITHDLGVVAEICDDVAVMYGGKIVESGPVASILANPQHPYTRGLLACIPRLNTDPTVRLSTIAGTVPSPKAWPQGCRFENRCPVAMAKCSREAPPKVVSPQGHFSCWIPDQGTMREQVTDD
ncbi:MULTISPECIES: ABC transporter ATP-binding protein [Rhizobium/Agrobacterium group]|uniref:ABC transporter ATP-binding protein n=1 Tax=Rhizobium/Agrobacterium group TaxID=227290 RepID=UPI002D21ED28|nr:ABC transporter ATP-binding protein [Xaviernesmea oryzae]